VIDVKWGDAPSWVASILSGISVIMALSIIRRDRRKAEASQARRIQWVTDIDPWASFLGEAHSVTVKNNSDAHVMDVRLRIHPKAHSRMLLEYDRWERKLIWEKTIVEKLNNMDSRLFEHNGMPARGGRVGGFRTDTLMPGEEKELLIPVDIIDQQIAFRDVQTLVEFRDAANTIWQRDVVTGQLKVRRYTPARTMVGFRLGMLLVVVLMVPLALIKGGATGAHKVATMTLQKLKR